MTIYEIRTLLEQDKIDYSTAFEFIKKLPISWQTKEWKLKRNKLIKQQCEQCASSDGVMVAQHLIHPPRFATIRNQLFQAILVDHLKVHPIQKPTISDEEISEFIRLESTTRDACPKCKWIAIRTRKKMLPKFFCEKCKLNFETPIQIQYCGILKAYPLRDLIEEFLVSQKMKDLKLEVNNRLYMRYQEILGKQALLISIDHHIKYTNLDEVVTFCKKCAASMDLNRMLLCWACKENYFQLDIYETCFKCFKNNRLVRNPFYVRIWDLKDAENRHY